MATAKGPIAKVPVRRPVKERRAGRDRGVPSPARGTSITIAAVGLRDLMLKELPHAASASKRTLGLPIPRTSMSLNAGLDFPESQAATLTLSATVTDMDPEPLMELSLRITAVFMFGQDVSRRQVADYLNRMGGGIVFPYIRETVHSVMARSIFGTLLLPPTIVSPLFTDAQMAAIKDA